MHAPFTYAGGKRRIAPRVWREIGNVYTYLEPFAGSAAVLLGRPQNYVSDGQEVIGDLNGYIVNAYRCLQWAADETARYAWWPAIHADLTARHRWLVRWGRNGGLAKVRDDPEYHNPKVAGWWLWGISLYIGTGTWCAGAYTPEPAYRDIIPLIDKRGSSGSGMSLRRQQMADDRVPISYYHGGGRGVDTRRNTVDSRALPPAQDPERWVEWFRRIRDRMAKVTVLNRPWESLLLSATIRGDFAPGPVGVFLDPPYATQSRAQSLYALDNGDEVAPAVWEWAQEYGVNPRFRIAICGMAGDFDPVPEGWRTYEWTSAGFSNRKERRPEVVLFSPHCLGDGIEERQGALL